MAPGEGRRLRLNLGAGAGRLDGWENVDRATGGEIYPLTHPDGSVAEIRASHVLEHFSHRAIHDVVADWVRVLEPGGRLRIAVPDFEAIARAYLAGSELPVEAYVMGGHVDENDRHGAVFDADELRSVMRRAGLIAITRWTSEIEDCAALPISLNLQGTKRPESLPRIAAVMSVPRLAFMDNALCLTQLAHLGIPPRKVTGAFWGQCLTRGLEQALEEDAPDWLLTVDYDTVFTRDDVLALVVAATSRPDVDAVAALQIHRSKDRPLFTCADETGEIRCDLDRSMLDGELLRVRTAHFGLTLIRAAALRGLRRPWFHSVPDADGRWGDGRTDDDVAFWRQWERGGCSVYVACRVPVGHAELLVRWPNHNLEATHQHPAEFWDNGKPEDVWQ